MSNSIVVVYQRDLLLACCVACFHISGKTIRHRVPDLRHSNLPKKVTTTNSKLMEWQFTFVDWNVAVCQLCMWEGGGGEERGS